MPTTTPARLVAATCLVATALLSAVSVLLQPEFTADPAGRLAAMHDSGTTGTISLLTFVVSQLPFLVAVVAIALLGRPGSPRLAVAGGVLATIGGFGHAVFGGVGLAYLAMSSDVADRANLAEVITRVESGPALAFMASGMLGTVLGLLLLGTALFRSRAVPRWVPLSLWAFLAMEFGSATSPSGRHLPQGCSTSLPSVGLPCSWCAATARPCSRVTSPPRPSPRCAEVAHRQWPSCSP